jgi:hypothetical protein
VSPTPTALAIANAEAIIDVTGTGNDILRRIQTRAPLQDVGPPLNYGLQSMESVCKLFRSYVTGPGQYGYSRVDASGYNQSTIYGDDCTAPSGGNAIDPNGIGSINLSPPPTAQIWADSTSFANGGSTTLHWSSIAATTCTGSGFNTGGATGGAQGTGSLSTGTYTYSVSCTGPSGTASDSVIIRVTNPVNCSDYQVSVNDFAVGSGIGWIGNITGNNPCGVQFAQCNIFNSGGGSLDQFGASGTSTSGNSPKPASYAGCQSIQGVWGYGPRIPGRP